MRLQMMKAIKLDKVHKIIKCCKYEDVYIKQVSQQIRSG